MKDTTQYTPEFWQRAIELQMTRQVDKVCEICHRHDGWVPLADCDVNGQAILNKRKNKPLKVVVGLRHGEEIFTGNLGLFCTRCRRGKYQVKLKREQLEKLIYPLFGA